MKSRSFQHHGKISVHRDSCHQGDTKCLKGYITGIISTLTLVTETYSESCKMQCFKKIVDKLKLLTIFGKRLS